MLLFLMLKDLSKLKLCLTQLLVLKKESESLQVAYTMGAMTIAAAMSESTGEVAATDKYEENTLSFNFAF